MDLIERQAAIDAINTWDKFGADERCRIVRWHEGLELYVRLRDVLTSIVNLPAVQGEIIACGDCKHWICHDRRCGYWNHGVKPLDWCCHAERRTDERTD